MELQSFVFSALVLLLVASVSVTFFKRIGLGAVLGLLVAGVIVGPHTPGPLVTTEVEDVREFTELGVVLLLFLIGLEMQPSRLWHMRRELLGLGSLQILLTGGAIAAYFAAYDAGWQTALLLGMTLALSSTAFVMQLLRDRGEIASAHGSATFSVLLMQDLAIVPLLAALPLLAASAQPADILPRWDRLAAATGTFVAIVVCGRWLLPRALEQLARHDNREAFLMVTMLSVFFAAWATARTGLSMALGAFLMGMLLSNSRYSLQLQATIEPYKGLLLSIFFVAVGMSIDVGTIAAEPRRFVENALAVVLIKLLVMMALGAFFRLQPAVIARMSFLLAQCGEFGFVLLGAAHGLGVIDERSFVHTIGIISATMLATPLMARIGDALGRRLQAPAGTGAEYRKELHERHPRVLIGGYGRVGHVVAVLLQRCGIPFLAFDTDPESIERGRREGHPVYFGDISDVDLLAAAGAERVALAVLTVDGLETALRAAVHLRTLYPQVSVIARARDFEASRRLLDAGVTVAFPEVIESSLQLAANTLEHVGVAGESVELLLREIRGDSYRLVRERAQSGDAGPVSA